MKKIIFLSFALILGLATQTQAQSEDYRMNAGISINYAVTGDVLNLAVKAAEATSIGFEKNSTPSIQATFDYGLNKWFSLGLAASYQNVGYDFEANTFFDEVTGMTIIEDYSVNFSRTTVALRPLFHYANNDRVDLYSGLRVQYFKRDFENSSKDPNTVTVFEDFADATKVRVSIVAFGMRYYITENIGLGTEINLGRPYLANFSVNARF